jgi:cobalt-precorrin-5B (C1)-methyltransferase
MTAAAMAALRCCLNGSGCPVVAVRLPDNCLIPVSVHNSSLTDESGEASVIKDGGDDPDVTHKAEIGVRLRLLQVSPGSPGSARHTADRKVYASPCIYLTGGEGVGRVTKPGLPIPVGEPAVNPVPRQMLCCNLTEELLRWDWRKVGKAFVNGFATSTREASQPPVMLPLAGLAEKFGGLALAVEVWVKDGEKLAAKTLNPRLGIVGGISILGTTGLVKPFSHQAYEETVQSALSVAASNGCREVVLSTGGKSERLAMRVCSDLPPEAFVQIADFYAFSLMEAQTAGFLSVVHSVFFGKLVKMAQGHDYTHAHKTSLDLNLVSKLARDGGHDDVLCRQLAEANTARQAFELLRSEDASDVIHAVAALALENSVRLTANQMAIRILLFDYDGALLVDIST